MEWNDKYTEPKQKQGEQTLCPWEDAHEDLLSMKSPLKQRKGKSNSPVFQKMARQLMHGGAQPSR